MQKHRSKTPTFVLRLLVLIILVAASCSGKAAKAVEDDRQGEALQSVEERAYNRRGDQERKAGVSQGLHGGEEERTRKKRDGKADKDRVKKKETSTRAKKKNKGKKRSTKKAKETTPGKTAPAEHRGDGNSAAERARKAVDPNFLFIVLDGAQTNDFPCYANAPNHEGKEEEGEGHFLPHMAAICREGIAFSNAFSESGSTPSRAALLTGQYAFRSGMVSSTIHNIHSIYSPAQPVGLPEEHTTMAEALKSHNYVTGFYGIWHLGLHTVNGEEDYAQTLPMQHGFDRFYGTPLPPSAACNTNTSSRDRAATFSAFWSMSSIVWQTSVVAILLARCCGILSTGSCCTSYLVLLFCAIVPFTFLDGLTVSDPASCILMRQDRIVEQPYDANTVNSRVAANAVQFLKNNLICSRHRCREIQPFSLTVSFAGPKETEGPGRAAAMQELDTNVGTVMSALRHLALDDSTLVILTSAAPDRFSADLSEAPFRVPLFARWRTFIEPGTTCHHPVDLLDIYPTVAALANVFEGILPAFDGKNLMPLLFTDSHDLIDEVDDFRERVLFHHCGPVLIGTTIGEHTMIVETGGRASICSGTRHNPPYYISTRESAARFTLDSPGAGKVMAPMLSAWAGHSNDIRRSFTDAQVDNWPRASLFPCCDPHELGHCNCTRDEKPKGSAPRARPHSQHHG